MTSNRSNETVTAGQTATFTAPASDASTVQWQNKHERRFDLHQPEQRKRLWRRYHKTLTITGTATSQSGDRFRTVLHQLQ